MAAKPTRKQSRKELFRDDDAFLKAAGGGATWITDNRVAVIGAVVVLLGLVAAGVTYTEVMRARSASHADQLAEAVAIYNAEILPEDQANPEADPPTFPSEKRRDAAARDAFAKILGSGVVARLYYADTARRLGESDAALTGFKEVLAGLSPDDPLYFLAVERLAYAYEALGDTTAASQAWERLAERNRFYADRSAYHRARLAEVSGQKNKAVKLYTEFQERFPDSSLKSEAEGRLVILADSDAPAAPDGTDEPRAGGADLGQDGVGRNTAQAEEDPERGAP